MNDSHAMSRLLRSTALALACAALPAAAGPGDATNDDSCCQLTTSLAQDDLRGSDVNGDERFFTAEGAPPNIHFIFDNSGSMRDLPQAATLDLEFGCGITSLNAYQTLNGWNPATTYELPDPGTGIGSDTGYANLFQSSKLYAYRSWGDSSNPSPTYSDATSACSSLHPGDPLSDPGVGVSRKECNRCLAEHGYYRKPFSAWTDSPGYSLPGFVLTGNFLNFNPPKYVSARAVIKSIIKDLRRVRAGITVFDGTDGGDSIQRQNPTCDQIIKNSASWDSNRASYISNINGLDFRAATPLAETLLNVGQLFSTTNAVYTSKFGIGSSYLKNEFSNDTAYKTGNRSWCWGCQVSSVIIITDGQPTDDSDVPAAKLQAINGGPVVCPDEDAVLGPDCGDGPNEKLDDVAKFLATKDLQQHSPATVGDLNTGGTQSLLIYGVAFAVDSPILKNAATVGGGAYYKANDAYALKRALQEIIANVEKRATSFAATSIASLQLNRTTGSLLPRFKPGPNGLPWNGFLYRFDLTNEFALGCIDATAATTAGDPNDIDNDGRCGSTYLVDAAGNYVFEDDEGIFRVLDDPDTLAVPFWEAGDVLRKRAGAGNPTAWTTRKIWTVIDTNGDNKLDSNDAPIEFKVENAAQLMPYLGIAAGTLPTECVTLADYYNTPLTPLQCAEWVIRYYRGADIMNSDPNKRLQDQPYLLKDIFHSSPITVDPPNTPFFAATLQMQTLPSLYATETDMKRYPPNMTAVDGLFDRPGLDPDGNWDAFWEFIARTRKRNRVALVGGNDGMLHAFDNGSWLKAGTVVDEFTAGTGEELWAFVPPDLLPKMKKLIDRHGYFVDNAPMVREVWLDGVGGGDAVKDGIKQWSEYRTIAITGSGMGGKHRFALDLTALIPNGGVYRPPSQAGDFLWMWPQPCDTLALKVGEAFSNYAPKAPPIGPIAMADPAGPFKINNVQAREQWVVAFNGGYDRNLVRGRGLAMVDMATGKTLWDFFHGGTETRSDQVRHPITAGIAMMDLGTQALGAKPDEDLLFDTLNVGDMGGQLWTARFWYPGQTDASGRVTNWSAARAFKVKGSSAGSVRPPITYITSNVWQNPGKVRTFLGTGDRYNLMDTKLACRLSNPLNCMLQGCDVRMAVTQERGGTTSFSGSLRYDDYILDSTSTSASAGGNSCQLSRSTLSWAISPSSGCSASAAGSLQTTCSGASSASWACSQTRNDWVQMAVTRSDITVQNRFYGFHFWGQDTRRVYNTPTEAAYYDSVRLSEDDLWNATTGNPSVVLASKYGWYTDYVAEERTGSVSEFSNGNIVWNAFIPNYQPGAICATAGANEARLYAARADTGMFAGNADYWQTGAHGGAAALTCEASTATVDRVGGQRCRNGDTGLILGGVNDKGQARYVQRDVVAAPGDPTLQLTIAGGQGSSSIVIIEPGRVGGSDIVRGSDLVQSQYVLEVTPEEEACRHGSDPTKCK